MAITPNNNTPTDTHTSPVDNQLDTINENNTDKENTQSLDDLGVDTITIVPEAAGEETKPLGFNVIEKQEDTRGRLAQLFLLGFFICLIGVSIIAIITDPAEGKTAIDNLRESVLMVSGILSGPLGFIIGYYFRKSED